MNESLRAAAVALYDRFTHETLDRRAFMAELTKLAGSAAAASALLASIAPSAAAATAVALDPSSFKAEEIGWRTAGGRSMKGYLARPRATATRRAAVIVIHENRGLNDHIRDVAGRLAAAGHIALAPDFLSVAGGTPADEDAARAAIGRFDLAQAAEDGAATGRFLESVKGGSGTVGLVGFCWGGAMVHRIALAAGPALKAGISFYGPAPDPSEVPKVKAAMQLHLAGRDERVNKTALPWGAALKAAGKTVEVHVYENTDHAFHNDRSEARYAPEAAKLAWRRTLDFLKAHAG